MKKIGLLAVTLVMVLGGLGIGYAAWTDTVNITGTANTGTVDLVVEAYSGMWAWKVPGEVPDELVITGENVAPEGALTPAVAYASAAQGADLDDIVVTFNNIFPLENGTAYWYADALIHYAGSIPVKVSVADITVSESLAGLTPTVEILYYDAETQEWVPARVGLQLHYCDYIYILIGLLVPQDNATQGLRGTVSGTIEVIQWNDFVMPE